MLNIQLTLSLDINFVFFINYFCLDMDSGLKLSVNRLDVAQQIILNNVRSLLMLELVSSILKMLV